MTYHARGLLEAVDLYGIAYRVHIRQGIPLDILSAFAEHAEVAVLGTRARAGIAGVLIGNTAERILHRLGCSVLAVKPPGFVSPVRLPEDREPGRDRRRHGRTGRLQIMPGPG